MKVLQRSVNAEPSVTYHLSPEQIQFFNDNGYIVVKKLIDLPALNSYRERFIGICNGQVERGRISVVKNYSVSKKSSKPEEFISKIQDLMFDEVFSTYTENPNLLHIISQLIGDELTLTHSMIINKPPGGQSYPPHQDLLHFPIRPIDQVVTTWTAIDRCTRENGYIYVVPGSHKPYELLKHDHIDNGIQLYFEVNNWETIAPEHKRVYLEMDPGDTLIFSMTLVHGSIPNRTKEYRRAISCHYANSSCQYVLDVSGTVQEPVINIIEEEMKRRAISMKYDLCTLKMKKVKSLRSHL